MQIQALLMTGYLLYDTSQVIRRYGPDNWLQAVTALYVDVINLFLFILTLSSWTSSWVSLAWTSVTGLNSAVIDCQSSPCVSFVLILHILTIAVFIVIESACFFVFARVCLFSWLIVCLQYILLYLHFFKKSCIIRPFGASLAYDCYGEGPS